MGLQINVRILKPFDYILVGWVNILRCAFECVDRAFGYYIWAIVCSSCSQLQEGILCNFHNILYCIIFFLVKLRFTREMTSSTSNGHACAPDSSEPFGRLTQLHYGRHTTIILLRLFHDTPRAQTCAHVGHNSNLYYNIICGPVKRSYG